jgi:D-serine dehydratase
MDGGSPLDWRTKGVPPRAEGCAAGALAALGLPIGDLMMPAAVLREAPLAANIAAMQAFADRAGALLCPHGKTHMSPELIARQLAAGAWGMTAATAHHVRIYRRLGVRRILLASQPVAPADMAFLIGAVAADPDFDFYCLVDSLAGAALLDAAAAGLARPLNVLVETGAAGGRSGLRTLDAVLEVARAVAASDALALRGVETFEGIAQAAPGARGPAGAMIDFAVAAADAIAAESLFAEGPVLLSAGGSAFLDLCAARLPDRYRRVIRPGCYITHDSGIYARLTRPGGTLRPGLPELAHALEVWGAVLSVPEPGRVIVGAGKRDLGFDVDLPVPLLRLARGASRPEPAPPGRVAAMWDQHLAIALTEGALAVGDLVGFGISHPCATFDRWQALLTVDEDYRVTGAVTTLF